MPSNLKIKHPKSFPFVFQGEILVVWYVHIRDTKAKSLFANSVS